MSRKSQFFFAKSFSIGTVRKVTVVHTVVFFQTIYGQTIVDNWPWPGGHSM